jgi:2,3-bisphosphoglycerate-dependent phosphoglycerate mutase
VRHGQSIWNHDSKFTGWTNIPLTSTGREEAKNIGQTLRMNKHHEQLPLPTIFFSSVLERAFDTTDIIRKEIQSQATIFTSWRLNEKHYGTLEGLPRESLRKEYGDKFCNILRTNFYMRPPVIRSPHLLSHASVEYPIFRNCYFDSIKNGESKENVLHRLLPYFQNDILSTALEGKVPLVVSHKHCMRVLMKYYLQLDDETFEHYHLPDQSIIHMKFDAQYNYISFEPIQIQAYMTE